MQEFHQPVKLGRTGLEVSRIGIGSSYGVPARAIERAFHDRGVNLLYWGSMRTQPMQQAIRNLLPAGREKLVIVLQSYDRTGPLMGIFLERGLKALGIEFADLLILGWHDRFPSARVMDAALKLKDEGKVRFLALSGHDRSLFGELARQKDCPIDVFMFRYNAAHTGAEREILPHLSSVDRPGTMAYTATRWGTLLRADHMPEGEAPLTAPECYRFVLSHPGVDVCLTGPATEEQMDQALSVLDRGPLDPTAMERIRRIGSFVHERIHPWMPRWFWRKKGS